MSIAVRMISRAPTVAGVTASEVGDEPLMHALTTGARVVVCPDRAAGARYLEGLGIDDRGVLAPEPLPLVRDLAEVDAIDGFVLRHLGVEIHHFVFRPEEEQRAEGNFHRHFFLTPAQRHGRL